MVMTDLEHCHFICQEKLAMSNKSVTPAGSYVLRLRYVWLQSPVGVVITLTIVPS